MAAPEEQTWKGILEVIHGVSTVDDLDGFGVRVLEEVNRLIPSDNSSFNEVDPVGNRAQVVTRPHFDQVPELEAWQRWSHQNPALMHMLRTEDGSARRLSDFLTLEELHRLELYQYVYRPIGVEYQLSVGLATPRPLVLGVALNRGGFDFTDEEVGLFDALRPHLVQAYHRAQLLTEQRDALESIAGALREEGRAFYVLGTPLVGPAAAMIRAHFGEPGDGPLPAALRSWLEAEGDAFASGPPDRLRQPLVSYRDGRRLTMRYVPGGSGPNLISLDERVPERDAEPLRRLGLSRREAEVLWWLSKGLSTADVARELALSIGTVKKHLERVYRKLGVSTRTAAAAQAFDVLTTRPP
jgi:DNA-binding CsgD family transcriptional regulator